MLYFSQGYPSSDSDGKSILFSKSNPAFMRLKLNRQCSTSKGHRNSVKKFFCAHVPDLFHSCFQLSGSVVLAVGLWLRFDPDTANLLAENDAPEHFFIGELEIFFLSPQKMCT